MLWEGLQTVQLHIAVNKSVNERENTLNISWFTLICVDKTIYWRTENDILAEQTDKSYKPNNCLGNRDSIIKPAYKKLIWSVPSVNNTDMEVVPEPEIHKV